MSTEDLLRVKIAEMEANIKELKEEYVSLQERFKKEEADKQVGVPKHRDFILLSACLFN